MAFLDDVQNYCNTDDDVTEYIGAAESYIANCGISKAEYDPLYALAVKMLVSYWYDNRIPDAGEKTADVPQPYGLAGILLQLQLAEGAADDGG